MLGRFPFAPGLGVGLCRPLGPKHALFPVGVPQFTFPSRPPLPSTYLQDLENKYMVIFQNYAKDLDAVQKLYEKNKYEPPVPRNAPPVAGNIMWARQLLRRIEAPMQRFAQNKNLLAAKESKKIIKTYNKVRSRIHSRPGCPGRERRSTFAACACLPRSP